MIRVVHCKKEPNHEYIGRPSALGNPFTHKDNTKAIYKVATREEAVIEYRPWLIKRIKEGDQAVIDELMRLKQIAMKGDLNLGCWCAPKACHGDVVKEILEEEISKRSNLLGE